MGGHRLTRQSQAARPESDTHLSLPVTSEVRSVGVPAPCALTAGQSVLCREERRGKGSTKSPSVPSSRLFRLLSPMWPPRQADVTRGFFRQDRAVWGFRPSSHPRPRPQLQLDLLPRCLLRLVGYCSRQSRSPYQATDHTISRRDPPLLQAHLGSGRPLREATTTPPTHSYRRRPSTRTTLFTHHGRPSQGAPHDPGPLRRHQRDLQRQVRHQVQLQ